MFNFVNHLPVKILMRDTGVTHLPICHKDLNKILISTVAGLHFSSCRPYHVSLLCHYELILKIVESETCLHCKYDSLALH